MPVKVKARRRRLKVVKRNKTKKVAKTTRVVNASRLYDLTSAATAAFGYTGAITAGSGYFTHTNSATQGVVTYGAMSANFRFADLPSYTEYTAMYEQYKINKVVLTITPIATGVDTGSVAAGNVNSAVIFHYCIDYDDSTVPSASQAGIDLFYQRSGYTRRNIYAESGKPIRLTIKPKVLQPAYAPGVTFAYQPKKAGWIDSDYVNPPHYGFKCITESVSPGAATSHWFKMDVKMFFSLKGMV